MACGARFPATRCPHQKGQDVKLTHTRHWLYVLRTGLLFPALSHAYSIGSLQVSSAMGEPFRAQVLVSGLDRQDGTLSVQPPDAQELARLGVQSGSGDALRFETRPAGPGQVLVLIRSDQPVNAPYLDVVVRLQSRRATRVQHLVALVQPPPSARTVPLAVEPAEPPVLPATVDREQPLQVSSLPPPELPATTLALPESAALEPATVTALPELPVATVDSVPVLSNSPQPDGNPTGPAPVAPAAPVQHYTVRQNDSLWKIARRLEGPLGQSAGRIATQLHQLNRGAFLNDDPNRLRSGARLVLPQAEKPAPVVTQAATKPPQAPAAKPAPQPPRSVLSRHSPAPKTQLTLIAPTASGLATGNSETHGRKTGAQPLSRELAGQVSTMRQKTASLRKEVLELDAQVNLNDQKIAMQNARLAELQQRLKARKEAQQRRTKSLHSLPAAALGAVVVGLTSLVAEPAHAAPAAAGGSGGSMMAIIIGVLVVVAIGAFVFLRNKSKPAPPPAARPQAPAARPAAQPAPRPAAPAPAAPAATAPVSKPAEPAVTVDPLVEARNFLEQERLPQAVGVLNRALNQQPKRADLMLMLLDIYLIQNDREGFEQVFAQLKTVAGSSELAQAEALLARFPQPEPEPEAVVEHKAEVLEFSKVDFPAVSPAEVAPAPAADDHSDHALEFTSFAPSTAAEPAAEAPSSSEALSLDALEAELNASLLTDLQDRVEPAAPMADTALADLELTLTPAPAPAAPELSLSAPATPVAAEPALPDQPVDLQFDLDDSFSLDDKAAPAAVADDWAGDLASQDFSLPDEPAAPVAAESSLQSLNLDQGDHSLQQQISAFDAALPSKADSVAAPLSAGLGYNGQLAEEFGFVQDVDAQALNLDLARQYAGLGEMEGARELLDEVLAQGNAEQQQQARQLKAQLIQ